MKLCARIFPILLLIGSCVWILVPRSLEAGSGPFKPEGKQLQVSLFFSPHIEGGMQAAPIILTVTGTLPAYLEPVRNQIETDIQTRLHLSCEHQIEINQKLDAILEKLQSETAKQWR